MNDVRIFMLWNSTLMSQSRQCLLKCNYYEVTYMWGTCWWHDTWKTVHRHRSKHTNRMAYFCKSSYCFIGKQRNVTE